MKNVLNTLLVSSIVLGGSTLGMVAKAAEPKTEDEKGSTGHVQFEKGDLSFAPQLEGEAGAAKDTTEVVPTFDFASGKVGEASNGLALKLEGENSKGKGYKSTGVSDYSGEAKGWHVTVKATEFTETKGTKAIVNPLTGLAINFEASSTDVTGQQKVGNETKVEGISAKNTIVAGGEAGLLFNTKGDESAGKFLFDYSKTTLDIPQAAAAGAKSGVDYSSTLTWNLTQGTKAASLQAAVPAI